MPTTALRPTLARDGIFNARDLGGTPVAAGGRVRPGLVVRADALHRCGPASAAGLRQHGVRLVLDLRDDTEREHEGVFDGAGIDVEHLPVLDPAYRWDHDTMAPSELLAHRYQEILGAFAPRFATALERIADAPGGVAYHCAVGKDRTGLLTALLLGALGSTDDVIVDDYALSARAGAVQVAWLWSYGSPAGRVDDVELFDGVWSARPATMERTLAWLATEHGGIPGYLRGAGLGDAVVTRLRSRLVDSWVDRNTPPVGRV
jgi:protein-tyrosine phosphatase